MPKNAKKDNIRIWTEKIFYYVELAHTISGFLINARDQLSKEPEKPAIPINRGDEHHGDDHAKPNDGGLQPEDEQGTSGG